MPRVIVPQVTHQALVHLGLRRLHRRRRGRLDVQLPVQLADLTDLRGGLADGEVVVSWVVKATKKLYKIDDDDDDDDDDEAFRL